MNANRISLLIPKPGEVEHWTYQNGGGGWDHPIHLHFEEGVTMNRGNDSIPATESLVRKDVWRLRPSGSVKFQVRFGEYGGAYVNHCHNTVHEDFALLMRYQVLTDKDNPKSSNLHVDIIPTPIPSPDGCTYMTPDVLVEGNPLGNQVTVSAAPVISSTPILAATVGAVYSYDVNATDANGDTLTYSLDNAPVGMGINGAYRADHLDADIGSDGCQSGDCAGGGPEIPLRDPVLHHHGGTDGSRAGDHVDADTGGEGRHCLSLRRERHGRQRRHPDLSVGGADSSRHDDQPGDRADQLDAHGERVLSRDGASDGSGRLVRPAGIHGDRGGNAAPVIDSRPPTTGKVGVPYNYTVHATDRQRRRDHLPR